MDKLQFDCPKGKVQFGMVAFFGFVTLIGLKSAITSYTTTKDSFYIGLMVACVLLLIVIGNSLYSYFKYKAITLEVTAENNQLKVVNKDENGAVVNETTLDLAKIHRAWILRKRWSYRLVVVLNKDGKITDEENVTVVPSLMYDIEEDQLKQILAFMAHHNPAIQLGWI